MNNAFLLLLKLVPVKCRFIECIQLWASDWDDKHTLEPKTAKAVWHQGGLVLLSVLFIDIRPIALPWPNEGDVQEMEGMEAVALFLDAIRVFFAFAYTPRPSESAFRTQEKAAIAYRAFFAAWKQSLPPTAHFMCTHAVMFSKLDGTAYHTLQEGVEHANKIDRCVSRRTFGPNRIAATDHTGWTQIIDVHQQRRQLLHENPKLEARWCLPSPANATTNRTTDIDPMQDLAVE